MFLPPYLNDASLIQARDLCCMWYSSLSPHSSSLPLHCPLPNKAMNAKKKILKRNSDYYPSCSVLVPLEQFKFTDLILKLDLMVCISYLPGDIAMVLCCTIAILQWYYVVQCEL